MPLQRRPKPCQVCQASTLSGGLYRVDSGRFDQPLDDTFFHRIRFPFRLLGQLSDLDSGRLPRRPMP